MRIQHNIMAMNAYRNYTNNVSAMKANLEKLSSGYKINRAGDDAAGLAISEKMRSQITGLDAAQKNVKDGISLVKTAEGAMQEVQDMLKRMKYLATQSANGTYQDDVDRENLQKEVTSLKEEINRIADSANFNGIKLLDGSQSGGGSASGAADIQNFQVASTPQAAATEKGTATFTALDATLAAGDKLTFEFGFVDKDGNEVTKKVDLTVTGVSTGGTMTLKDADGNSYQGKNTATTIATIAASAAAGIFKDMGLNFSNTAAAGKVTAAVSGVSAHLKSAAVLVNGQATKGGVAVVRDTVGKDAMKVYNFSGGLGKAVYAGKSTQNVEDFIFTINGKKFALAQDGQTKNFGSDVNVITVAGSTAMTAKEVQNFVATVNRVVGKDVAAVNVTKGGTVNAQKVEFKAPVKGEESSGGGLTLQIGDTADGFNQMQVVIGDMHTTGGMNIDGIDIGTLAGAQKAIGMVTDATNYVSSIRGDLGAIQNRLDHTLNNLSVMAENIQDAESTIRDTDVADEMMSYVKNNILVQSAQAMLAQAN
ncbi:MAG: flagellin, partial [Oscillospiraceae bacterium]|nr:flagellin [Oscillospiraceae bacterium]